MKLRQTGRRVVVAACSGLGAAAAAAVQIGTPPTTFQLSMLAVTYCALAALGWLGDRDAASLKKI
jgi:hypothetical protein